MCACAACVRACVSVSYRHLRGRICSPAAAALLEAFLLVKPAVTFVILGAVFIGGSRRHSVTGRCEASKSVCICIVSR